MSAKILALSPEAILPPRGGGSLRSVHLLVGLSKKFDVRVLLPQASYVVEQALDGNAALSGPQWIPVNDYEIYRTSSILQKIEIRFWNWRERRLRLRWKQMPWNWFFGSHHSWKPLLRWIAVDFTPDYFLVEHTRNAEIFTYARKLWPNVICICNSQNVESDLLSQILPPSIKTRKSLLKIKRYEQRVLAGSDILWTCSDDDMAKYESFGKIPKHSCVVPNGVDTSSVHFVEKMSNVFNILFVGNFAYNPNIEGAIWFHDNVWPALKQRFPALTWQLVGSWADPAILALSGAGINVAVDVPSVQPFLENATVAICPLHSGSGTRLKILEAFSAGIPVVSTSVGAEGLDVEPDIHLSIADSAEEFTKATIHLLENPTYRDTMRKQARALAERNYDWGVISDLAAEQLLAVR